MSVTIPEGWEDTTALFKEYKDEDILKRSNDSPDLAEKPKSAYVRRVWTMQSLLPEKSLQWMIMHPETLSARVKEAYVAEASQKAYFVAMIAIKKLNPVHQSAAEKWKLTSVWTPQV